MVQANIKELKKSVKGTMLIITILLIVMLIVNVALGVLLQSKQAQKNVESMLTDNLNGSYALVQKGMSVFENTSELTPENWNIIISGNSCNTVILDNTGKTVASYMKNGSAAASYKDYVLSSGQKLYPKATGSKGNSMCYAAKAIENTDYTLLIGVSSADYYGGLITAFWVSIALVVVMTALAVITNIFFAKVVVSPLNKIRDKIMEMSRGNLSGARVEINTDDELGVLASSVNYLADCTNDIINDIHYTADEIARENLCVRPKAQYNGDFMPIKTSLEEIIASMKTVVVNIETAGREVSASSAQMSTNSSTLSMAADEGTATVQQLSESLNGVHAQINDSAEKAGQAQEMTSMSVIALNQGNEKMSAMLDAMREINATSAQIANIIKTIQDISFQTNILSLNASIEAARAGAAGKGFAVVAGEVGSLAGKTAEAAKSTTKLIETSLKAVEHGTVIANETAEMLSMTVGKANESAEMVAEIAQAATRQAESIKQSIDGMERITVSMAQVNTAAHDCADSSQMLANQSAMLADTVNKFVIDEKNVRSKPMAAAPKPVAAPKEAPAPVKAETPKPKANIELPDDSKPTRTASKPTQTVSKSAQAAPKPTQTASKPAQTASKPTQTASKPAQAAPKPAQAASKPTQTVSKPTQTVSKPAQMAAKPAQAAPNPVQAAPKPTQAAPKPAQAAPKPVQAAPKLRIELPDDNKTAPKAVSKPAFTPAPKASSEPSDDDNASAGKVVKKATMQPVKRTVRIDPNKY